MTDTTIFSFDPAEIDCSGPWLIYPESQPENIIPSLKNIGQLTPVLVMKDAGKIKLLAGRARVAAAAKLGLKVSAIFIEAADDISKGIVHLEENRARVTDDALKLAAFRFFSSRMQQGAVAGLIGPLLGMKPKSRDIKFWLDWMELESEFDELLRSGNIPLAAVSVLGKLTKEDRGNLIPYFEKVSWSRSNAVNFLTWLYETSRREGRSVTELLKSEILYPAKENESPKDAVARLCKAAKELRYPRLSGLAKTHEKIVSEICAGTKWRIESTGNFETGEVMLQTRFKSREMMQKAVADLDSIEKHAGWETLFDLGRDE
ncbi:ParB N-terminal domain-containing protein [Maridesulfovibrio hydrothermalis]|uniref:ParB domain protein nuclease n=1 Tax=Maridesulfovibrio hydrothermalis AM13 = DSM 14728 TaxID=1121451 RepID=L0RG32_9BACT|nr:ParB N-terminal domain-containing protein [Maridesulfovibrio hydrothermalis]CCO25170.1 ParB domain protein nuclease [Maridesulfovibrio hydrothermalis AM13 = DSM 14728]